jgi:hypothetical protein
MEINIIIFDTSVIPVVVIVVLILIGRRYKSETQRKDELVNTMENIIEMKNKKIKQLKSFRLLN